MVRSAYSLHTSGTKYYSMFLLSVQDGAKRNTQLFKIYGSAVNQTAQVKHHSEGKGETLDTEFNKTLKAKGKAGEYSDLRESEILHEFDNFHDFITYLTLDSPINAIRVYISPIVVHLFQLRVVHRFQLRIVHRFLINSSREISKSKLHLRIAT